MYTEVDETEKERDGPYMEQRDDNPLYEPATNDDAGLNLIYDRFVFLNKKCLFKLHLSYKASVVTDQGKKVFHLFDCATQVRCQ